MDATTVGFLSGIKVVDFSRYLAGPYCTMLLGDLGADVIKVERVRDGDELRYVEPAIAGESYPFAFVNRHKRSIAVDLTTIQGMTITRELLADADIVVESFRPGVVDKLGIDYNTVSRLNHDVIYCSVSGFGQTGPYRHRPGFDIIAQGLSGVMSMTGNSDDRPVKVGFAAHDMAAAMSALSSILAACVHRLRTGEGQYIDVSLLESGLAMLALEAAEHFGAGQRPKPTGTRHRLLAPYQVFQTRDGYLTVGANNEKLWQRFCVEVLQQPQLLQDSRYTSIRARVANVDELERDIEDVLTEQPTSYWVELLDSVGVPGGPVLSFDQTLANEHVTARNVVMHMDHPVLGQVPTLAGWPHMSGLRRECRRSSPALGEHTEEILRELRFTPEEVEKFVQQGVVGRAGVE